MILSVVIAKGGSDKLREIFGSGPETIGEERAELCERLDGFFSLLAGTLGTERVERLTLNDGRWLGYYGALLNGRYHPVIHRNPNEPISFNLPEQAVRFGGKAALVEDGFQTGRQVRVYSLKNYPGQSFAGILDGLQSPVDMVLSQSYSPIARSTIGEALRRRIGQMKSAGDAAVTLETELGVFADGVASGGLSAGKHHATVVLFGTADDLRRAEQSLVGEVQILGGTLYREGMAERAAFFAQHPGNFALRPRQEIISNAAFADLAAFHMRPSGLKGSKVLWPRPLAEFPTTHGEPFALSLHKPASASARTGVDNEDLPAGHALVLGPNGTGKTVIATFLASMAADMGVRIIAFDKDHAMETPMRAIGAHYRKVRLGEPTGMNPLQTETDKPGVGWLTNWLYHVLAGTTPLDPAQREEVSRAARDNAALPADLRTFDNLASDFAAFDDGRDLTIRAGEWASTGGYGWMFGTGGEDPFATDARHLCFDVTEILDEPEIRTAWLSYVLRQIEKRASERVPTMILIDEGQVLLDSPYFQKVIKDWYSTMRKKNCAVVLLTQMPDNVIQSAAAPAIIENSATFLMFPNRRGQDAAYERLGLNRAEIDGLRALAGQRLMLAKTETQSVWLDVDLAALGPLLTVLSAADGKPLGLAPEWRDRADFWKEVR